MGKIIQLKNKNQIFGLRALCQEFANITEKNLNWNHWFGTVGSLFNAKIADGLVVLSDNEYVGMLIWSYFPDLISGELSATETAFYVKPEFRTNVGSDLLDKMISICAEKEVINVNMSHFYDSERIGTLYKRKGFIQHETSYVLRVN